MSSAKDCVISGIDATLVAIRGIAQDIASPTGNPKPSYRELTIATLLLAYSTAISCLVRFDLYEIF